MTTPILQSVSGQVEYHEGPYDTLVGLDLDSTDDGAILRLYLTVNGRSDTRVEVALTEPDLRGLKASIDRIITAITNR